MLDLSKLDLKKEIENLRKNDPGKTKGIYVKSIVKYIKKRVTEEDGVDGFNRLVETLKDAGLDLVDIKTFKDEEWVPSTLGTQIFLAAGKLFIWQEKDFIRAGREVYSFSPTMGIIIKYFVTLKKTFNKAAKDWRKYYTYGEVEIVECDSKKKRLVVRKKSEKTHPVVCYLHNGVFTKLAETVIGKKVTTLETKCTFRGDPYDEYVFSW